jgi:ribosomal subunit interface protein
MEYQITSDNIEVSDSMKEMALSKLSKLEPRLKDIPEDLCSFRVVMNKAPDEMFQVKTEAIINGEQYFAEETDFTVETAMILVVEELERQLEKAKFGDETGWEDIREAKRFPVDDPDSV